VRVSGDKGALNSGDATPISRHCLPEWASRPSADFSGISITERPLEERRRWEWEINIEPDLLVASAIFEDGQAIEAQRRTRIAILLAEYSGRLFRADKTVISAELSMLFDRLGGSADRWCLRLEN
jgi:hypothetical protein